MKKVLFYGDSNTYGYDPSGYMGGRYPRRSRWTSLVADSLNEEWEVAVDGMPGRMIPAAGRGMYILMDSVRMEMPFDLFAVMLGTNDLISMRHPDAATVAKKMETMITSAAELLSTQILLIAPPQVRFTDPSCTDPFVRGSGTYAQDCKEQSQLLAQYYREIAKENGAFFADASSWDLDFAFDGVHLSEKGHVTFAKELEKVIRKIEKEI